MNKKVANIMLSAVLTTGLMTSFSGCAKQPQINQQASKYLDGSVVDVSQIKVKKEGVSASEVLGGVIGGVGGALLGNQMGGGNGQILATGAGAVGGAMVGAKASKEIFGENDFDLKNVVKIRLFSNNQLVVYEQSIDAEAFRVGDKVSVGFSRDGKVIALDLQEPVSKIVEKERIVEKEKVVYKDRVQKVYIKQPAAQSKSVSQTVTTIKDTSGKVTGTETATTKTISNVDDYGKAMKIIRE